MKRNGGGNNRDSDEEIDRDGAYGSYEEWYIVVLFVVFGVVTFQK
jgi:hypothetical protein